MFGIGGYKQRLPARETALPGRAQTIPGAGRHFVLGTPLAGEFPGCETAVFGLGCFWGAERKFWTLPGVVTTAVGYAGGYTPNPTYREVCSGETGHTEVVRAVYDPRRVGYGELLRVFWESHDPTQGMRQGNDLGTQYRSAIYWMSPAQRDGAERTRASYGARLREKGYEPITTEILEAGPFYFAEDYRQQYFAKHPDGYCGLGGTGVACPLPRPALAG